MTTVLVVDDEYLIVEVLTLALEDAGFMVTQASNGMKALDALHREGPSLVVCDYMMPLMNGLELATEIRKRPEWAHLPIVLMSGGHAGLASKAPELFDHILQKPFNIAQFVELVIELVGDPLGSG
ncbi:MAG: response regulator [Pseudomonadota bacterium]